MISDKDRLDWLETNCTSLFAHRQISPRSEPDHAIRITWAGNCKNPVRQAIDNAINRAAGDKLAVLESLLAGDLNAKEKAAVENAISVMQKEAVK